MLFFISFFVGKMLKRGVSILQCLILFFLMKISEVFYCDNIAIQNGILTRFDLAFSHLSLNSAMLNLSTSDVKKYIECYLGNISSIRIVLMLM